MRLIDKDALIEEIERTTFVTCELDNVFEAIENAPTIEIRPKGKWQKSREWYICSCCKWVRFVKSNYCPECGAEMGS